MSTNPSGAVLQSQRGSQPAGERRPRRETVALFFEAFGEGLAARRHYKALVARGVPPDRAVAIAFEQIVPMPRLSPEPKNPRRARSSLGGAQSMSEHAFREGNTRKLWPTETDKFRDHLLRLDEYSRRMRFAHGASEAFIEDYASRMNEMGSIVFGYFEHGELHAAAELRKLGAGWSPDAEAAFSVEDLYQNQGLGTELMGRVVQAARNRGVQHLYVTCLAENSKMQVIARKHDAGLRYEQGDFFGDIRPPPASYLSLLLETVEDRVGLMIAVLDLQEQMLK